MYVETMILDHRLIGLVPDYATEQAAAIDLRACNFDGCTTLYEDLTLDPGARIKIGTGVAIDLGSHTSSMHIAGLLLPRSGLGSRGITLGNSPGLLDADYTGEIFIAIWNAGDRPFVIEPLARLAQLVTVPIVRIAPHVVPAFSRTTARGAGGFGHTGL